MGSRKNSIMLVLLLLISLFVAGMWLISSLNLSFAERTMSEQRERQIADTFHASLARINAHHFLLERNVATLVRTGEFLLRNQQTAARREAERNLDRKSTRLNSSHVRISYAVFCLKKKNIT